MAIGAIARLQAAPQVLKRTTRLRDTLLESWIDFRGGKATTAESWFRASGISGVCPRATWLERSEEIFSPEKIEPDLNWKFSLGTAFHDAMQQKALPVALGDRLRGLWHCRKCGDYHGERDTAKLATPFMWHVTNVKDTFVAPWIEQRKLMVQMGPIAKPNECPTCKFKSLDYTEVQFVHDELRITGHVDALVDWEGDGELEVQEMKSCNQFTFEKIDPDNSGKPYDDHVEQGMTYVWLSGAKRLRVTYLFKSDDELKKIMAEHAIERNETVIAATIAKLTEARAALAGGKRPERLAECTKKSDKRAKYCGCKDACFRK